MSDSVPSAPSLPRPRSLGREAGRKAIHLCSVAVPALVWIVGRGPALWVILPALVVALATEWARFRVRSFRYYFLRHTRILLRHHERRGFAGATYMALGYTLALLLFPTPVAVVAMLYSGLGDAAAALIGRRFGRRRAAWGKSWEGFAAGVITNVAAGLGLGWLSSGGVSPAGALLGGVTAAALEFAPLPLDDNLKVTVGGGIALGLGNRLASMLAG